VTYNMGLFFVSVETGICMSHFKIQSSDAMLRAAVLSDGRIFVGGSYRNSFIFQPPPEVADYISCYTDRMYSHSAFALVPSSHHH